MHFWIDKRSTQLHYGNGGRRRPGPGVFYGGRLSGSSGGMGRDKSLTSGQLHYISNSNSSNNGASSSSASTSASSTPSGSGGGRTQRANSSGSAGAGAVPSTHSSQTQLVQQQIHGHNHSHHHHSSSPQSIQNQLQGQVQGQGQMPPPPSYGPPLPGHEHLYLNPTTSSMTQYLHGNGGSGSGSNNSSPIQSRSRSRSRSRDHQGTGQSSSNNLNNSMVTATTGGNGTVTTTTAARCDQCDPDPNLNDPAGGQRTPRNNRRRSSLSLSRRTTPTPTHQQLQQMPQNNLGADFPSRDDTPSPFSLNTLPNYSNNRHLTCSSSLASSTQEITDPKWSRRKRIGLTLCFLAFILLCNVAAKFIIEGPSLIDASRRSHNNYNYANTATATGSSNVMHDWSPTGTGSNNTNNHNSGGSSTFYFFITELVFVVFALTLFFTGVACLRKGTNDYLLRQFNQHILQQQQQQQQNQNQQQTQQQQQQQLQSVANNNNTSSTGNSTPTLTINNNNTTAAALGHDNAHAQDAYFDIEYVDGELNMTGRSTRQHSHLAGDLIAMQGRNAHALNTAGHAPGRRYIGGHHLHQHRHHGSGHAHGNRHYHAIQIQQPPPYHIALYLPLPNQEDFENRDTDVELKEYNNTGGQIQIQKVGGGLPPCAETNNENSAQVQPPSLSKTNTDDVSYLNRKNSFEENAGSDQVSVTVTGANDDVIITMDGGQRSGQSSSSASASSSASSSNNSSFEANAPLPIQAQASFEHSNLAPGDYRPHDRRGDGVETPPPSYDGLTFDI